MMSGNELIKYTSFERPLGITLYNELIAQAGLRACEVKSSKVEKWIVRRLPHYPAILQIAKLFWGL